MKKSIKVILSSLLLAIAVIGFSSYQSDNYDANGFDRVCFYYLGGNIADPDNWTEGDNGNPPELCTLFETLCAICFDDSILEGGKPPTDILECLEEEWENGTTQGEIICGVEVYRKPFE